MNGIVLISGVGWGVCISNEFLSWLSACVIELVTNWEGDPLAVKFACIFLVASMKVSFERQILPRCRAWLYGKLHFWCFGWNEV